MKNLLLTTLLALIPTYALSQNSINLSLPSSSQSYQSDSFRTGELDCSNAIGSATQLEFGVTGLIQDENGFGERAADNIGVYGRITIPLGKIAKDRINCNELYELELQKKRLELLKLEEEVRALRNLQFEN